MKRIHLRMRRVLRAHKLPKIRGPRTKRTGKPTGYVIFRGASLLDGAPIVVIAVIAKSKNRKTGPLIQTYILRSDLSPLEAIKRGLDYSICGDCLHRGKIVVVKGKEKRKRSCYVNVGRGATVVFKKFARGGYPDISGDARAIRELGIGRKVRLGTYGDPGAAPAELWRTLTSGSEGWTGYTHQWRARPELASLCMASVDSLAEQERATDEAWRTFRVAAKEAAKALREIACPASEEAGKRTTCADCMLCGGTSKTAANIVILSHGSGRNNFVEAA